jgi:hypothetical protein
MKRYASGITGPELSDAAFAFREKPSADNWMLLERLMKAHQMAEFMNEQELNSALDTIPREKVTNALVRAYDKRMDDIQKAALIGNVRLIRADEFHMNS